MRRTHNQPSVPNGWQSISTPVELPGGGSSSSPPATVQTIVGLLAAEGLNVKPWFFQPGRDRLAWITLNGSEPIRRHMEKEDPRWERREACGRFELDWCRMPSYDYSSEPWRSYIPLRDLWNHHGSQGWVFRKLNPNLSVDPSSPPGLYCLQSKLKSDILLTYRALQLIISAVTQMYEPRMPPQLELLPVEWVDEEYSQVTSLNARVWDARRAVLQMYGWISFQLNRDSLGWRNRKWDASFNGLVQRLGFLNSPRRGAIVDPFSIPTSDIITLVRHNIPVHYKWRGLGNVPPLGGWIEPTPQAACFNPYSFSRAYDFAAYKKAGGPYDSNATDRAILGSKSAGELSAEYHRHPRPFYELPVLPPGAEKKKKGKKAPMRFFVREFVGGELTEVTKGVMLALQEEEDGGDDTDGDENEPIVVTHNSPSGDMKLVTKRQHPQNLRATDLNLFFSTLDGDKSTAVLQSADGPGPSSLFLHPPAPAGAVHGQQIQTAPHLSPPIEYQAAAAGSSRPPVSHTLAMVTAEGAESRQLVGRVTNEVRGGCTNGQQIPQAAPRLSPPIEHQAAAAAFSSCRPARDVDIGSDSEDSILLGSKKDMSWDLLEEPQSSRTLAMVTDEEDAESRQLVENATDGVRSGCTEDVPKNSEEAEPSKGPDTSNTPMVFDAIGDGSRRPDPIAEHPGQPAGDVQQAQSTASVFDPAHLAPAVPLVPPQSRRDAAIEFIRSSFPPVVTQTVFCGPEVPSGNATLLPIPDHVQQVGRLAVPANTELRMRVWHLADHTTSISSLLTRCLAKGLPYRISLPLVSSTTTSYFPSHAFSTGNPSFPLIRQQQYEKLSERMVRQYHANVRAILGLPDARKFLTCGGLLWRIVKHYAPGLYPAALQGPSSATDSPHQHLDVDPDGNYYTDLITPEEIKTLLGVTTNSNSFWPYPMWYEGSNRYNGEWTEANEAWFIKHANNIKYSRDGCLRSGRNWQTSIRTHTLAEASGNPGTIPHARACCTAVVQNWPDLWAAFDISRLR